MKKYPGTFHDKFKNFIKLNTKRKLKWTLKVLGIKHIIYNILYFFLSRIIKSKNYFLKGVVFDALKHANEITIIKSDFNERFILFTNDNVISKEMFINGKFDLIKLERALKFLNQKKKINTIYDIGANIGVICIPAVKRGLIKNAFAVEPEKKNFELLKLNISLNHLEDRIISYNYALSNKDDEFVEMELASDNYGDHRIKSEINFNIHGEEDRKTIKVKTKKFDTLFKNINPVNDLIWMDTQGYEPIILSGANNLINSKAPLVLEFWPYALKRSGLWKKMFEHLKNFDYYVDLSDQNLLAKKIDDNAILELQNGWGDEIKDSYSLYTDLILLKE
jgi:FkbM family methyltransferase